MSYFNSENECKYCNEYIDKIGDIDSQELHIIRHLLEMLVK